MKLRELISEAPLGQTIGQAVGKAAFGAGQQAGKTVAAAAAADQNIKAAGSAFDQGRGDAAAGKLSQPLERTSPFDTIPDKDAKYILANIINGKPLDSNQMAMIKKVYNKL